MSADIRDLCRILFKLLFRNDSALVHAGTGNDERIGDGNAHQPLTLANRCLKVQDRQHFCDEAQPLGTGRSLWPTARSAPR